MNNEVQLNLKVYRKRINVAGFYLFIIFHDKYKNADDADLRDNR